MKTRDIVCKVASGAAGVIWPPLSIGLILGAVIGLIALLKWLWPEGPGRYLQLAAGAILVLILLIGWMIWGFETAKKVHDRCSRPNGPGEP